MNKGIYGVVAAGLSFLLLTGCYSSLSVKQAIEPSSAQPSVTPPITEKTVSDQTSPTATPSGGSTSPSQPNNSPAPVAIPESSKNEKAVEQQNVSSTQNEGQQIEAGTAESQTSPPSNGQTDNTASAGTSGETVEQVTGKYETQLTQLKGYYTGQLQQLFSQAAAAKKSGKSNREIYNTYSQNATALEEDSQAKVNQLLLQMKDELTAHDLSADKVKELRSSYYDELNKIKENISEKAKTDLGM